VQGGSSDRNLVMITSEERTMVKREEVPSLAENSANITDPTLQSRDQSL
jgi:hypothetical protein